MQKPSQPVNQKKNKGGRPKKLVSGTPGSDSTIWKRVSHPVSTHTYEVNSRGEVRRLLKTGAYYNVKPWITGGPYAAVYIYGVKGATRNRKKVYVHRLVAQAFVGGKRPGNVVHHKLGPASNTKSTLEWVTPSQNLNARKYFNDDGTRRKKTAVPKVKVAKVKVNVPSAQKPQITASAKAKPAKNVAVLPSVAKPKNKALPAIPADEYHPANDWPFKKKLGLLMKKVPAFMKAWKAFRKEMPTVTRKNFLAKFKEATGKGLEKKLDGGPANWNTRIRSAMYAIRQKLKV